MVNEFCGFKHGVIGTDKMPADTTLNNMKKADLIKLLHTAQHNYESLMWFYNNAVKVNMAQLNNNGWIPCSERLPEANQRCLIYCKSQIGSGIDIDIFEEKEFQFYGIKNVKAWQPLPERYRETAAGQKTHKK